MPSLIILIILSLVMFCFYRVRAMKIREPYRKKYTTAKASVGLGAFLLFFGANRLFIRPTAVTAIICGIFILYGLFIILYSFRELKYYLPKVVEEARKTSVNNGR